MEAPYTIASLPKPLDAVNGKTWSAPVYGVRAGKKRKRHEVAVGIDGEGLSIYNVQSQSVVQSYALPPQTYLCAPPCSVHSKLAKELPADRETYVVLKDGAHDVKRRLVCFSDIPDREASHKPRELKLRQGDIFSVEVVLGDERQVLVCYKDGHVDCIAADLSRLIWSHRPSSDNRGEDRAESEEIEYCCVLDLESAKKGLLKSREDVVATLDTSLGNSSNLLCCIVRVGAIRRLQLHNIRASGINSITIRRAGLFLVMEHVLPSQSKRSSTWELHGASGSLYELYNGSVNIYDLSGVSPRLSIELPVGDKAFTGFARLSSSLVLATTQDQATVYDTKYGSVQATTLLTDSGDAIVDTKKRKRDAHLGDGRHLQILSPVATFTDIGLIAGLVDNELLGLQLAERMIRTKRARPVGTSLTAVAFKGAMLDGMKRSRKTKINEKRAVKWESWNQQFEQCVAVDDTETLENFLAKTVFSSSKEEQSRQDRGQAVSEAQELDFEDVDRRKLLRVLASVFCLEQPPDDSFADAAAKRGTLAVRIQSLRILQWLALSGGLRSDIITSAWRFQDSNALPPGAVMQALRGIDPEFQLIRHLLALPVRWDIEEVVVALKLLIQSFDAARDDGSSGPQLALPAPNRDADVDHPMLNGDAESHADEEANIAQHELDHAVSALSSGLEVRSDALRSVIERLRRFSTKRVTAMMQAIMTHKELIFFIHVMRIELANGGWTMHILQNSQDGEESSLLMNGAAESEREDDFAIRAIAVLLNCAVDAIGITGWLVGLSDKALGTLELIETVQSEISAALEGIHEASAMLSSLQEMERFDVQVQHVRQLSHADQLGLEDELNGLLPLGANLQAPVVESRGGNRREKTRVHLAREANRRVGMYTFEQIRI